MAPSGLYARLCHAFLVFIYFLSVQLQSNEFSGTTGRIFTNFSGIDRAMSGLDKFCIHLAIAQGMLPWQPTKENRRFAKKFLYRAAILKGTGISKWRWAA